MVAVIRFDAMQTSDNCISSHKLCVCVCVTKTVQDPRAPRALGREYDLEFPKEDLQAGGFHTNLVTLRMTLWGLWVLSWSSALLQLGDSHPPPGVCQDSFATHPWSRGLTRRSEGKDRNTEEGIKKVQYLVGGQGTYFKSKAISYKVRQNPKILMNTENSHEYRTREGFIKIPSETSFTLVPEMY